MSNKQKMVSTLHIEVKSTTIIITFTTPSSTNSTFKKYKAVRKKWVFIPLILSELKWIVGLTVFVFTQIIIPGDKPTLIEGSRLKPQVEYCIKARFKADESKNYRGNWSAWSEPICWRNPAEEEGKVLLFLLMAPTVNACLLIHGAIKKQRKA